MMNFETTNSWIFLAIALASRDSPAKLSEISMTADGIAHAIPTEREVQFSIWWLMAKRFVSKKGIRYRLTEEGKELYEKACLVSDNVSEIWNALSQESSMQGLRGPSKK